MIDEFRISEKEFKERIRPLLFKIFFIQKSIQLLLNERYFLKNLEEIYSIGIQFDPNTYLDSYDTAESAIYAFIGDDTFEEKIDHLIKIWDEGYISLMSIKIEE